MPKLIFSLEEAKKFLNEKKAKTVIVQIPEGFKDKSTEIADSLKEACENVFVKMDPCFGACDLPLKDKEILNADAIIHIGHAPIHSYKSVFFIPCEYGLSKKELEILVSGLAKELAKEGIEKAGLGANTQYVKLLPEVKKMLYEKGITAHYGKGTQRVPLEGQVLGCNTTSLSALQPGVDANIYIGDGYFHSLGIVYSTKKPVFFANPMTGKTEALGEKERDRLLRKRFGAIAKASEAESIGIIVSVKSGQRQKEKALALKEAIERHNKKAYLFETDLVNESYFTGAKVDCLVNTACNRIVIDDAQNWKTILINPTELLIALGELKWEQWVPDEIE